MNIQQSYWGSEFLRIKKDSETLLKLDLRWRKFKIVIKAFFYFPLIDCICFDLYFFTFILISV